MIHELKSKLSKVLTQVENEESEEFVKGYKWALGVVRLFISEQESKNSVSLNLGYENKKLTNELYKAKYELKNKEEEISRLKTLLNNYNEDSGITNKQFNRLTKYLSNVLVRDRKSLKEELIAVAYNNWINKK